MEKGEKIHDWNDPGSLKPAAIRLMLKCLQESARQPGCSISCIYVSIGTLESDLLSQSTPGGTKWILVYLLRLYSTGAECL